MAIYQRNGQGPWYLALPTRGEKRKMVSTRILDRRVAEFVDQLIKDLGPRGRPDWFLLEALDTGTITFDELYEHRHNLEALRNLVQDRQSTEPAALPPEHRDLNSYVKQWESIVYKRERNGRQIRPDTARRYIGCLRTLIPEHKVVTLAELDRPHIRQWLGALACKPAGRGYFYVAAQLFFDWLCYECEIVPAAAHPLVGVKRPAGGQARTRYLTFPEVLRLIRATPSPYKEFWACLYGSGADLMAAFAMRVRDFYRADRRLHIPATKSDYRDRIVPVMEWAWPHLEAAAADKLPEAPLFDLRLHGNPKSIKKNLYDAHKRHIRAALGPGRSESPHDARRHLGVMLAAGTRLGFDQIGQILGHADGRMARRHYAQYRSRGEEFIADFREAELVALKRYEKELAAIR